MRTNRSIQEYCEVVDSDVSKIKLAIDHIEQARAALHDVNMKHLLLKSKYFCRGDIMCCADLSLSYCKSDLELELKCIKSKIDAAMVWNKCRESLKELKSSRGKQG